VLPELTQLMRPAIRGGSPLPRTPVLAELAVGQAKPVVLAMQAQEIIPQFLELRLVASLVTDQHSVPEVHQADRRSTAQEAAVEAAVELVAAVMSTARQVQPPDQAVWVEQAVMVGLVEQQDPRL
jgi:hypothetical protein